MDKINLQLNKSKEVLTIIVTYNSDDLYELKSIIQILSLESDIIIIDNSDSIFHINEINQKLSESCTLIQLFENKGIAYAQNIGINKAINNGYNFVFFLDDDSKPCNLLIEKLKISYFKLCLSSNKIASVSARPQVIINNCSHDISNIKITFNEEFINYNLINSSGTLIPIDLFNIVGKMNEDYFIDLVDFDWGWRATKMGFKHYICRDITFDHKLGNHTFKFFGLRISKGSPIRNFYSYRNTLLALTKKYVPINWKIKTILKIPFKIFIQVFIFDQRLLRLKYIILAFSSAFTGNYGKLNIKN